MENELLIALLAGLGGMLGWGLADFFAKITIDRVGDIVSLVWAHFFGTIFFLVVALFQFQVSGKFSFPGSMGAWLGLIFFGVLQALVYLFVYKGFGKGQLAVLNPVFASFSGLTALFSIIFLGEAVTKNLLFALALIFLGILFLNMDSHALRSRKISFVHIPGFKEVALATVLAASWTILWDKFVGGNDWVSFALFMYLFMTISLLVIAKVKNVKLAFREPTAWKYLILIGACETVAYLAISLGYGTTSFTSIVALLSGAFSLPTIILARIFLKEKITPIQTFGTFVVIAGIIFLSLI